MLVAAFVVVPTASLYKDRNSGSTARRHEVAAACAAAVAAAPSFRATKHSRSLHLLHRNQAAAREDSRLAVNTDLRTAEPDFLPLDPNS